MKEWVSAEVALRLVHSVEKDFANDYPGLVIRHRKKDDKGIGSSFSIDVDSNCVMLIDARSLESVGSALDVSTIDVMHIILELYHEEGHLLQYRDTFKRDDLESVLLSRQALIGRCMPEYKSATYWSSVVEADAERHGLCKTKLLFESVFVSENIDTDESKNGCSEGEMSVDAFLTKLINDENKWYGTRPVGSVDKAIVIFRALITKIFLC